MNPQPKNVTVPLAAIVLFAVMAAAPPARAGTPDVPPAGMGAYIVVLKDPALVPAGETPVPFEDGEIGRLGGRLVASHANMREVLLPLSEAKRLREHPAVAYVQRMWMGEPLDRWVDDESPGTPRRRIRTLQENDLTWTTGTYRYDGSGNIRQIGADTYGYDSAGRLSRAAVNGMTETYRYDSFGNLLEKNLAGRPVSVPVDPMSNRVTGESYDAAGNLLTREGQPSFVYDSMGMVVTSTVQRPNAPATTRRHLYDADDERLGTVIDANLVRWTIRDFGGRVLREYESNNDRQFSPWWWTEDYVYAEGKLVAGAREPFYGGERHFHLDHLGSVRLVTHGNDLAASRHDYYPFGTEQTSVVQEYVNLGLFPNPEPMKFTGHERDYRGYLNVDNTDYLDYMHARYYDPKMGRFLSVDPVLGDSSEPQSWNRYSYVRNNPVNATDPTGMTMWSAAFFREFETEFRSAFTFYGQTTVQEEDVSDWEHVTWYIQETAADLTPFGPLPFMPSDPWQMAAIYEAERNPQQPQIFAGAPIVGPVKGPAFTEPTLPPKTISTNGRVIFEHNYRSNDHPPAHAHVHGGGGPTRILPNGGAYPGDPPMTAVQRAAYEANKSVIRRAINKIARWLDYHGVR